MQRSFALSWVLNLTSVVAFPLAAVQVSRRRSPKWLAGLAAVWAGSLIGYGAWLGAPEMSLIMIGLPLVGATMVAWRTRTAETSVARGRTILTTLALCVPGFCLGLLWGIMACRGGCV